ncbi:hypothetical protein [Solimicrobium silvestre]|uniref:Phosphate-selective porin O and P n=1 Tax=Solimicrobium silvestre TaxID=2099400 RepID=A0A2S9GW07_9BURK|nr:hypothetical protein [Solimicrobium silvestre]PRC91878.1 Phosphate-selective porin O and P [Solimicrobium silvestre]
MMNKKIISIKLTNLIVASLISIFPLLSYAGDAPTPTGTDNVATETPMDPKSPVIPDTGSNFHVTGFLSVIGGNIFNGSYPPNYIASGGPTQLIGVNCPCYYADYSNGGVYGPNFSLKPESHAGVQIKYDFSPQFNFVGQVTVRGTDNDPNIQWAYVDYKLNDHWEIHVGRQRIPLYYYSPFQDVGFAIPWVAVPPELYGWEATNYDGASLRYSNSFGNTNFTSSIYSGGEKLGYSAFYTNPGDTDVHWNNIVGADAEINNGPLTLRLVYLQANTLAINIPQGLDSASKIEAYGLAVNLDFDTWFMLSEVTQLTRDYGSVQAKQTDPASTIGVGYRLGKWTPFVNYALFTQHSSPYTPSDEFAYKRASLTLRYDIDSSSDIKTQVDRNWDTTNTSGGNVNVVRVSYDRVF